MGHIRADCLKKGKKRGVVTELRVVEEDKEEKVAERVVENMKEKVDDGLLVALS